MGKKPLPHRYFTRYLFSLLIILLIPLMVLGGVLYGDIISLLEQNAREDNQARLYGVRDDFDRRLTELASISSAVSAMDITRRSAIIPRDFLNDWNIIEELGRFSLSNDVIDEIVLYIPETATYYSSSGVYRDPYFFRDIFPSHVFTSSDLIDLLDADMYGQWIIYPEQEVTLANTGTTNIIPAAFTVPFGSFSPYGVLLFLLSTESLERAYRGYSPQEDKLLVLENSGGEVIFQRGNTDLSREITGSGETAAEDSVTARADLEKFSLVFRSAVPSNLIREQVSAIQRKALISLAAIFLLAIFLIPYLAIANYSPIKRLLLLSSRFLPDDGDGGKNELTLIGTAISDLADQRDMINGRLNESRRILQSHLLNGLAMGRDFSPDDIGEMERELNIHLKKQRYCVFFIGKPGKRLTPPPLENRTWTKGKQTIYIMKKEKALLCLMTGSLKGSTAESIVEEFLRNFDTPDKLRVSLGKAVPSLTGLRESYTEAVILNNNDDREKGILSLEHLPEEMLSDASPDSFLEEIFELTGLGGTREKIRSRLDFWLGSGEKDFLPRLKILKLIYQLQELSTIDDYRSDLLQEGLLKLCRGDEIRPLLVDVLIFIKSRRKTDLIAEITDQIEENYVDPAFSLTLLAERTGKSTAYLSRYFKEKTGSNLTKTIRDKRLDEARRLLKETDKDLETIVTSVGYYDVSSFIRLFKKETGLTPGQYRNQT